MRNTVDPLSWNFVPPQELVETFDQDATQVVQPFYTQLVYRPDRARTGQTKTGVGVEVNMHA